MNHIYTFNRGMKSLKHILNVLRTLWSGGSGQKLQTTICYLRLIGFSWIHHKTGGLKTGGTPKREKIMGFTIQFYCYPTLITLFEEIFIEEVYNTKIPTAAPLIMDCGSNIGVSILYFKSKFPDCRIEAFEPHEETFKLLEQTIRTNRLRNVTAHCVAIGDTEETTMLYYHEEKKGSLNMSIASREGLPNSSAVRCRKLSSYILDTVDLIKLDIEGAELQVIQDLIQSNKVSSVAQLVLELHDGPHQNPKEVLHLLQERFDCVVQRPGLQPDADEVVWHCSRAQH